MADLKLMQYFQISSYRLKFVRHRITFNIQTISFSKNFQQTFTIRKFDDTLALLFLVDLAGEIPPNNFKYKCTKKARQFYVE